MTYIINQIIVHNPNYINEYGHELTFGDVLSSLWGNTTNVMLSITFTSSETVIDYNVLPDGVDQPTLESNIDDLVTVYANKILSSIEAVVKDWELSYTDYKQARSFLKTVVIPLFMLGEWVNFSLIEKKICALWFVVPSVERFEAYPSAAQQIKNGDYYNKMQTKSRTYRFNAAKMALFNLLDFEDASIVINEVSGISEFIDHNSVARKQALDTTYVEYGRESFVEDGFYGLFDYVQYTLSAKSFTPQIPGFDMPTVSAYILDILQNGNYTTY